MIYQKLLELAKKKIVINKDGKANYGKYATLDNIIEKYTDVLNEIGLVVVHITKHIDGKEFLCTRISETESNGERVETELLLCDITTMQKLGASLSYAKRYNLGCLLNIVTDEDTDMGNKEDVKVETKKEWFNDKQLEKFIDSVSDGKVIAQNYDEAIKVISKKYSISKVMKDKILKYYTNESDGMTYQQHREAEDDLIHK